MPFVAYLLFKKKPVELKHLPLDKAFDFKMRGMDLEFEEDKHCPDFKGLGFFTYSCHMEAHEDDPFCPWTDGVELMRAWTRATEADFGFFDASNGLGCFYFGRSDWPTIEETLVSNIYGRTLKRFAKGIFREVKRIEKLNETDIDLDELMKVVRKR